MNHPSQECRGCSRAVGAGSDWCDRCDPAHRQDETARLRADLEQARAEALRHINRLQEDLNVQCQARMRAEQERDAMRAERDALQRWRDLFDIDDYDDAVSMLEHQTVRFCINSRDHGVEYECRVMALCAGFGWEQADNDLDPLVFVERRLKEAEAAEALVLSSESTETIREAAEILFDEWDGYSDEPYLTKAERLAAAIAEFTAKYGSGS